jgi:hypothetical protein
MLAAAASLVIGFAALLAVPLTIAIVWLRLRASGNSCATLPDEGGRDGRRIKFWMLLVSLAMFLLAANYLYRDAVKGVACGKWQQCFSRAEHPFGFSIFASIDALVFGFMAFVCAAFWVRRTAASTRS